MKPPVISCAMALRAAGLPRGEAGPKHRKVRGAEHARGLLRDHARVVDAPQHPTRPMHGHRHHGVGARKQPCVDRVERLKPELAARLKKCFYDFRFPAEMQKEFNGDDRFLPITYAKEWAVVRDVAEKSGTPYNKAAYDAEAKREAEAAAKKAAEAASGKK